VWIWISLCKPYFTPMLTYFPAIVSTKQYWYWYKYDKHSRLTLTASTQYCTRLNTSWNIKVIHCDTRFLVIRFNTVTEHVLHFYWWGCVASSWSQCWSSMTHSHYIFFSVYWRLFVCVCVCACMKTWAQFWSEYVKEQVLLWRPRQTRQGNIKMDF
jgi:hypothetical protein